MLESASAYPAPSASVDLPDPDNLADAISQLHATRRYASDGGVWAIGAVGVIKRNAIKFHGTAACLDKAVADGIIK